MNREVNNAVNSIRRRLKLRVRMRLSKVLATGFKIYASRSKRLGSPGPKAARSDFGLVMMTGEKHIPYLRQCLGSICHNWPALPPLTVVGDGTISVKRLEETVSFYGGLVRVIDFSEVRGRAEAEGFSRLVEFGDKHIMGKKLLVILSFGTFDHPALWCDSDFLWFRPPSEELIRELRKRPIAMAEDFCCSYDRNVLSLADRPDPHQGPFFNAGLVLVSQDLRRDEFLDKLISVAVKEPGWHTEQTVLSVLAAKYGGPALTRNEIYMTASDYGHMRFCPPWPSYAGKPWLARHYAMALWQFWRDAAALCWRYESAGGGGDPK